MTQRPPSERRREVRHTYLIPRVGEIRINLESRKVHIAHTTLGGMQTEVSRAATAEYLWKNRRTLP